MATDERTHARTHASDLHARADAMVEGYTLTVEDVAAQLGKSPDTVRRYIRAGKLAALRVEGEHTNEYRIHPDDLGRTHACTQAHTYDGARMRAPARVDQLDLAAALGAQQRALVQMAERIAGQDEVLRNLANAVQRLADASRQPLADARTHAPLHAPAPARPRTVLGQLGAALVRRFG
jgi:excisionase family DNA binding protein